MTLRRLPGIALFTLVETATLGVWLALVRDAPTLSTVAAVGAAVLVVGLVVEALINTVVVNGFGDVPLGSMSVFSVTEALIWVVWLVVAERVGGLRGVGVAGVVLFVLMLPQHSVEDNVLRGRGLFDDLLHLGTVGFTAVETVGGTVWLAFVFEGERLLSLTGLGSVPFAGSIPSLAATPADEAALLGLAILAVALLVEHAMGVAFALRGEPGTGV